MILFPHLTSIVIDPIERLEALLLARHGSAVISMGKRVPSRITFDSQGSLQKLIKSQSVDYSETDGTINLTSLDVAFFMRSSAYGEDTSKYLNDTIDPVKVVLKDPIIKQNSNGTLDVSLPGKTYTTVNRLFAKLGMRSSSIDWIQSTFILRVSGHFESQGELVKKLKYAFGARVFSFSSKNLVIKSDQKMIRNYLKRGVQYSSDEDYGVSEDSELWFRKQCFSLCAQNYTQEIKQSFEQVGPLYARIPGDVPDRFLQLMRAKARKNGASQPNDFRSSLAKLSVRDMRLLLMSLEAAVAGGFAYPSPEAGGIVATEVKLF